MTQLVTDCPRCHAKKTTFDVLASYANGVRYTWQLRMETFSVCRACDQPTVFILYLAAYEELNEVKRKGVLAFDGSANDHFSVDGHVSLKDFARKLPPEHLPNEIEVAFIEGATCHAVACYNAAATMFRLCIDHATRALLPPTDIDGLNSIIRRSLGLRMRWLFDHGHLPESLRELSTCVKEDGNDGAHAGTLSHMDAEDILDFTTALLERLYTEPERIRLAKERRDQRRKA